MSTTKSEGNTIGPTLEMILLDVDDFVLVNLWATLAFNAEAFDSDTSLDASPGITLGIN